MIKNIQVNYYGSFVPTPTCKYFYTWASLFSLNVFDQGASIESNYAISLDLTPQTEGGSIRIICQN